MFKRHCLSIALITIMMLFQFIIGTTHHPLPSAEAAPNPEPNQFETYQVELLGYVNARRAEVGLDPLELQSQVTAAATEFAEWLHYAWENYRATGELYYGETEPMNIKSPILIASGYEAMPMNYTNDVPEEYKLFLPTASTTFRSSMYESQIIVNIFCDNVALEDNGAIHAGIGRFEQDGWVTYVLFVTKPAEPSSPPDQNEEPTSTPVPTETPTLEPTLEPTIQPTLKPTLQPTNNPTNTPQPTATDAPMLGCQKNNPGRLDCSSLQVSGTCDGLVAIFTITNTGEAGNGDMRASTQWRIVDQDGNLLDSGQVLLNGGASMTVTYQGEGKITLYADQQIGHPGNSQPQATVNCNK